MYYTVFCWDAIRDGYRPVAERVDRATAGRLMRLLELDDHDVEFLAW